MAPTRREFLRAAAGAAAGLTALGTALARDQGAFASTGDLQTDPLANALDTAFASVLPDPGASGIDHVIVVMMENRSFDHFLGWLPRADGRQAGLAYPDPTGVLQPTWHATMPNGCGFNDPDHSYDGGRVQYDGGAMDGFLRDTANDRYAISYYEAADRPFMSSLALNYTTADRYFCSILGPTYPNRLFQHAAATDRLDNTTTISQLPTIWDRLNQPGGPTGRYYFSDVPFLALWGSKYLPVAAPYARFLADAAAGTLPNVSFIDPRFEDEGSGTSGDDHPLADIRAGDAFLSQIFQAVAQGPAWDRTVLIVNYDEWGGFFDHVAPGRVTPGVTIGASPTTSPDQDQVDGKVLLGLRVPIIVASPFTRGTPTKPRVTHHLYDHTSVLKLIEWRWGLSPLSARDASDDPSDPGNLAHLLNFSTIDPTVPDVPVLAPFAAGPCAARSPTVGGGTSPTTAGVPNDTWAALAASPLMKGWT
jgi:phospholipase C